MNSRRCSRACGIGPTGARDAALLALLYGCGLRRAEAVALDLADYAADTGTVIGKGGHQRQVFATIGTRAALDAWRSHRGEDDGPLLFPVAKGGRIVAARLSTAAVWARLRDLARRAGVRAFSPHDLRRSFVGELLDAEADVVTVQALAGHANVQTTARYDRRGERAQRSRPAARALRPAGALTGRGECAAGRSAQARPAAARPARPPSAGPVGRPAPAGRGFPFTAPRAVVRARPVPRAAGGIGGARRPPPL